VTKTANAKKTKVAAKRVEARRRPRTAAEKVAKAAAGWAGDDLEEVIAAVTATRLPSKF